MTANFPREKTTIREISPVKSRARQREEEHPHHRRRVCTTNCGGAGSSKRDWSCGSSKLIAYSFGIEVEAATPERVENVSILRSGRLYPIRPNLISSRCFFPPK